MVTEYIVFQVRVKLTSSQKLTGQHRKDAIRHARFLMTNSRTLSNVNVEPMSAKLVKTPKKAVKK